MLTFTAEQSFSRPVSVSTTRNGSVDLLRFAGAIGIILFHCGAPGSWFGLAALPMFVMLLVFYGAGRALSVSARRLLVPWLIWSGIYAALKIAQSVVTGTPLSDEFVPWMFLTGPSIHLWFLPFSFLFLAVCAAMPERMPTALLWPVCIVLSAAALGMFNTGQLPVPFAQWLAVIPAACVGLLMQRLNNKILSPLALAMSAIVALLLGVSAMTNQLLIAGLVIAMAFAIQLPTTKASSFLSSMSLGMYLVHPALIAALLYVVPSDSPLFFPAVVTGSLALTLALKKLFPASV
ncbi:acyltransferase family protein [Roseibium album]|uniref:acyltransferase family protein n=1 Tax=Roseibium album TaxID=311410 RepID=UPI0024939614|nr:acyltransferase family protein [Roseibium album]